MRWITFPGIDQEDNDLVLFPLFALGLTVALASLTLPHPTSSWVMICLALVLTVISIPFLYLYGVIRRRRRLEWDRQADQEEQIQEKVEQGWREELFKFVARFNPDGEIVIEGDNPFWSASFNDQDGRRREILMVGEEFFEKIG
jgi:hypothetical protein